jgi:serine/threonine-protein kinase
MEYFQGRSLRDYILNRVKVRIEDKVKIIAQIGNALASVHEKDILHRDIKPDNILVNDGLNVKITDFGVCHLPTSDLTMTAELIGSPAYMAPEYLRYGKTSKSMDIYALGVVTYELMLGKKPFDADGISELIKKVFYEKPTAPDKLVRDFPPGLQDILARMIRKNPARRYQDAAELLRDLKRFQEHAGLCSCIEKTKRFFNYKFDWN